MEFTVNFLANVNTASSRAFFKSKVTLLNNFLKRNISTITDISQTLLLSDALYGCISLYAINFPACISIGYQAFYDCSSLQSVSFPACTSIDRYAFLGCTSLQSANFPECNIIGSYAFRDCISLRSIYLLESSVCNLVNSNAFWNTPIEYSSYLGQFGSIYVPESLVNAYKTSTNWTYYSTRIVGV